MSNMLTFPVQGKKKKQNNVVKLAYDYSEVTVGTISPIENK